MAGPSFNEGSLVKLLYKYLISTSTDGGADVNQDDRDSDDMADNEERMEDAMEMESEASEDLNIWIW